jgi:O-antigen/teichoic acid export membrane protein
MDKQGKSNWLLGFKGELSANFAGMSWSALIQIVCVPLYIKLLGIESYGLIGFYLMFQTMLQVLDLGLSPTINREMARYSVHPERAAEARDLVRTLEAGYWLIGMVAGTAFALASSAIATHWIKAITMPVESTRRALMLMGILAIFQWPFSLYQGGLMGLRRQVLFNVQKVIAVTISNGGAVLILWFVSPTIEAFFLWLIAVSAVQVVFLTTFFWKSLPRAGRAPRLDFSLLRSIGRFAAGMSGITVFSLVLGQADKVLLSKLLSLTAFGYYTLAGIFGTGMVMVVSSVFNTIYPRLSALVAQRDEAKLILLYHEATQVMVLLTVPAALVLSFFSVEVLQLWTGSQEIARNAGPIASILVLGTALNGLMYLPYSLQLAYGWTSIGLKITMFLTIVVVPAIWYMARHYGPIGAAYVWLGLNALNVVIGVPLTHARLLRCEMRRWFLRDVGPSLIAAVLVAGFARAVITSEWSSLMTLAALFCIFLAASAAAACLAPEIRRRLFTKLNRIWLGYA